MRPLTWILCLKRSWLLCAGWYYDGALKTGNDYFVLPPSGDLYSYPGQFQPDDQQRFVRRTERDCVLMNTSGTVEWEWFDTWPQALQNYYPRYSEKGIVRGLFAVNVPYPLPVWLFGPDEFYKVIDDHGLQFPAPLVLFRPREWRGATSHSDKNSLFAADFAKEINDYPPGTVTAIYLTSDGGGKLDDPYELVALLNEHVEVVNHETVVDFAIRHHRSTTSATRDF